MRIEIRRLLLNTRVLGVLVLLMNLIPVMPTAVQAQNTEDNSRSAVHALTFTQLQEKFYKTEIKKEISVEVHDMTLEQALREIARETGLRLSYRGDIMVDKMISLQEESISISDALANVLDNTGLDYRISQDGYLLITEREDLPDESMQETVTGTVFDAQTGEALPGVNILIEGTTEGTSTDADGNFELEVPDLEQTLVVTYVGYERLEIPIDGRTQLNIELNPLVVAGDELVVVGYGTQRRQDVISGISTISTEDLNLQDLNTPSPASLLKGRVSGVQIREGTGAAGSAPIIRIRGTSSVNAGVEPLIVVDGFPVGNGFPETLNPDDIANITVLKDAASTAIYGARGSNGVVVIETTNAREGMSELSYNSFFNIQQFPNSWRPQMLNAQEAVQYNIERIQDLDEFNNVSNPTPIPQRFLDARDALERGELSPEGYDWLDEFIQEGTSSLSQNHNLTYRTGTENLRAVISGGFLDQKSLLPGDDFERLSLRTKFDADLSERIQMGINLSGVRSINNRIPSDGTRSALWAAISGSPIISPYDEEGNLIPFVPGDAPGFFTRPNPIFETQERLNRQINRDLQANIDFDIEIAKGLQYAPRFFVRQLSQNTEQFRPTTIGQTTIAGPGALFRGAPPQNNSGMNQFFELENWGVDNLLRYNFSLDNHNLNFTLGQSIQKETGVIEQVNGFVFPSDDVVNFAEASEVNASSNDFEWALLAGFGQFKYNYDDRYLAEINFRREGSSRLGANNRYGNFPSGALGWRISNENFFPQAGFINEFLIRGSYGKTGNSAIGNFDALGTLGSIRTVIGGNVQEAKFLSSFENRSLAWETATQWQVGTTVSMLNNSVNVEAEYWEKITTDMLFNVPIPGESGFETARINVGEMVNKGVDVTLTTFQDLGRGFQWNSNLNISWTSNEVTQMPEQIDRLLYGGRGGTNVVRVGDEIGAFWGLIKLGLFDEETANDPNTANFAGLEKVPGTNHYKDLNGDGVIDRENDMTVIGSPHPDVILGFNNEVSYRNFSFSVLLTSMLGYEIMPTIRDVDMNTVARWNVSRFVLDRWKSPENPGSGFAPRSEVNAHAREWMDDWLEPGDHLWIKNIRLSYRLPADLIHSLGLSQLRFTFAVDNAARFDSYSGMNPEVSTSTNPVQPGLDNYVNPLSRSFSLGVNLTF